MTAQKKQTKEKTFQCQALRFKVFFIPFKTLCDVNKDQTKPTEQKNI